MKEELDFRPYTEKAYILFVKKNECWWAIKLVGFMKIKDYETGYKSSEVVYWLPAYCEEGYVQTPMLNQKYEVIFGREPTTEDARLLLNDSVVQFIGGELNNPVEVMK